MKYHEETKQLITEDSNGNITTNTTTVTKTISGSTEPDYIKLYTKMWCEFNGIPEKWRPLFMALVCRMSYANPKAPSGGQTVYTIGSNATAIMADCGWTHRQTMYKGLQALCDCNAVRKVGRGEYQINPEYAGRGEWKYNPRLERGGVEDLVATFNFKAGTVSTGIAWTDDNDPSKVTIRRVGRGAYQINPNYAAKGEWKYNPRLDRGGVEDLIATFNFRTGAINTQITWTADKADNDN